MRTKVIMRRSPKPMVLYKACEQLIVAENIQDARAVMMEEWGQCFTICRVRHAVEMTDGINITMMRPSEFRAFSRGIIPEGDL